MAGLAALPAERTATELGRPPARPFHRRLIAALMLPKEHGAWAMLLMPYLLGTIAAGWGGWPSALLLLAILSLFTASRPLELMLQGGRDGAAIRLAVYAGLGSAIGLALLGLFHLWLLLPMGIAAGSVLAGQLILRRLRLDRTRSARLASIAALSVTGPAAFYAGTATLDTHAAAVWLLAVAYSGASVFYVRLYYRPGAKAKQPEGANERANAERHMLAYVGIVLAAAFMLVTLGLLPPLGPLVLLPAAAKAMIACRRRNRQPTLRQIGMAEIGHSTLFLLLASVAMRMWA